MIDSVAEELRFPLVNARSLVGGEYTLPTDLVGKRNVLIVVFQRRQQSVVASWLPFLEQLMTVYSDLHVYTLVIVPHVYTLARPFIDGNMVASIPDDTLRAHTLTCYTDGAPVAQALQLATIMTISVLLLDRRGCVLWRGLGGYDDAQAAALEHALARTEQSVAKSIATGKEG